MWGGTKYTRARACVYLRARVCACVCLRQRQSVCLSRSMVQVRYPAVRGESCWSPLPWIICDSRQPVWGKSFNKTCRSTAAAREEIKVKFRPTVRSLALWNKSSSHSFYSTLDEMYGAICKCDRWMCFSMFCLLVVVTFWHKDQCCAICVVYVLTGLTSNLRIYRNDDSSWFKLEIIALYHKSLNYLKLCNCWNFQRLLLCCR